jgi:hypothetical protein
MACIKSAQRAALTALAPDAPYLAAGTMSGAVDRDFSASANIEIFSLDFQSESPDLPVVAASPSTNRFCWSRPGAVDGDSFSLGSVAVWNPLSMIRFARIRLSRPTPRSAHVLICFSLLQLQGTSQGRHGRVSASI